MGQQATQGGGSWRLSEVRVVVTQAQGQEVPREGKRAKRGEWTMPGVGVPWRRWRGGAGVCAGEWDDVGQCTGLGAALAGVSGTRVDLEKPVCGYR